MQISDAVAAFLNNRRTRRRMAATIDQYHYQLVGLWLPWRERHKLPGELAQISCDEFTAYVRYMAEEHVNRRTGQVGLADETITSSLRSLRTFWNFCATQGWLDPAQRDYFRQVQVSARRKQAPVIPAEVCVATLGALLSVCSGLGDPEERARNRAIIALLWDGLRVSELALLNDHAVDLRERRARLACPSGGARMVGWGYQAAVALRAYMRVRADGRSGALFRSTRALYERQPLQSAGIRRIVLSMARLAEVELPAGLLGHNSACHA